MWIAVCELVLKHISHRLNILDFFQWETNVQVHDTIASIEAKGETRETSQELSSRK